MTRNGDIRSLSGMEGIWRAGVKWEARDASARLQPLGMFFLLLYFFNYTNESFKGSMPANDDFKSDCGREGRWEWGGGSRYIGSRAPACIFLLKRLSTITTTKHHTTMANPLNNRSFSVLHIHHVEYTL